FVVPRLVASATCSNSSCNCSAASAAHSPPADAPENPSIVTSCCGTSAPSTFARYQASSASVIKSTTPAVYAPAEMAPAILIAILKPLIEPLLSPEIPAHCLQPLYATPPQSGCTIPAAAPARMPHNFGCPKPALSVAEGINGRASPLVYLGVTPLRRKPLHKSPSRLHHHAIAHLCARTQIHHARQLHLHLRILAACLLFRGEE